MPLLATKRVRAHSPKDRAKATTMAAVSTAVGESYTFVCDSFKTTVEESYTFVSQKFQDEFEECIRNEQSKSLQELGGKEEAPANADSPVQARYMTIKLQFSSGRNWGDGKPIRVTRGKWVPVAAIERAKVDVDFEEDLKWTIFLEKQATIMNEIPSSSSSSTNGNNNIPCCHCNERAVALCGNPQLRLDDNQMKNSSSSLSPCPTSYAPLLLWDLACLPVCDSRSCHLHAKQIQRKIMAATLTIVRVDEYLPRARCNYCGMHEERDGIMHQVCGRCKVTCYCSKECQTKDWKQSRGHKSFCKVPPVIRGIRSFLKRA